MPYPGLFRVLWLLPLPIAALRFYPVNKIVGRSMHPTLNPDTNFLRQDYALFNRVAVQAKADFDRGDIVVLRSPTNPKRTLVKRVIAKEGDLVTTLPGYLDAQVRIPKGHVWVEGDDPFHSDDSRAFGPIAAGLIQAKLMCILWPPERMGRIKTPTRDDLAKLQRDGPDYREAVAAIDREEQRQQRVVLAGAFN